MKRFVSALIAGAMILSMSVASFADDVVFGKTNTNIERDEKVSEITLNYVKVFRNDEFLYGGNETETQNAEVIAGDILYFAMNSIATGSNICGNGADKDWRIKVSKASNIDSVEFFYDKDLKVGTIGKPTMWVKVEISDDFNSYEKDAMNVWFYLYDVKSKDKSEPVKVGFKYADYEEEILYKNDVEHIVPLKLNTIYTLDEDVNSANVVFSYDNMYIVAKLYADEEYLVNSITTKYNKDMAIKYDADVEVISIVSNMDNYDVFFESSKDNKFIYEVAEDELVSVKATYMDKYEIIKGEYILTEGYLVENVEDNQWVVLDKEIVSVNESEEDKEEVKPSTPSTDKANPETGVGDFVGMASTMAVMAAVAGAALFVAKK